MIKVVFICLGNICRSPMAEAIFRKMLVERNLTNDITIDSAGTASWHTGKPPHEGTRAILTKYDISFDGQTARGISERDYDADYLVVMDSSNLEDVTNGLGYKGHAYRLLDLVDSIEDKNVPDPYFTGDFEETYRLVSEGCKKLLSRISDEKHLS